MQPPPPRRRFLRHAAWLAAGAGLGWLPGPALGRETPAAPTAEGAATGVFFEPLGLEFVHAPGHPDSPARAAALRELLGRAPLGETLVALEAGGDEEAEAAVRRLHPAAHVDQIARGRPDGHAVALRTVAGALAAVDAVFEGRVRNAFCATRPPGHHAWADGREEGFCFYNAVAIAAREAQRRWGVERVLVVDWDYHHGNGTETAFYADPSVLVFNTHDWHAYPGTGDPARRGEGPGLGFNRNVHLPCGSGDADILRAFDQELLPLAERFAPGLVLVSAGFDGRAQDPLGCFELTDAGFVALTQRVMDIARRHCAGRLVSVLEGGYDVPGLTSAVAAHLGALAGLAQPAGGSAMGTP